MAAQKRPTVQLRFPRPALTADLVITTREAPQRVLLIRRKSAPFAGSWALPGGFVDERARERIERRKQLTADNTDGSASSACNCFS